MGKAAVLKLCRENCWNFSVKDSLVIKPLTVITCSDRELGSSPSLLQDRTFSALDSASPFVLDAATVFVFFFLFYFCVPQLYLWGSPFWVRFLRMWPFFFNPTIEVVTFCLRGWCILGVFLLPAFTRLGHECQDLLSLWDGMHVRTD